MTTRRTCDRSERRPLTLETEMNIDKVIDLLKQVEAEIGESETTDMIFEVYRLAETARVEAEYIKERAQSEEDVEEASKYAGLSACYLP